METITSSQSLPGRISTSRFANAKDLALSLAKSDSKLVEPELVAWIDRSTGMTSPLLEGCSGPDGWRYYGISHGGRLEVNIDSDTSFIFTESSPFDSYAHFSPGPYRNTRDTQGNEFICLSDGTDCVQLDEWTSKLT